MCLCVGFSVAIRPWCTHESFEGDTMDATACQAALRKISTAEHSFLRRKMCTGMLSSVAAAMVDAVLSREQNQMFKGQPPP